MQHLIKKLFFLFYIIPSILSGNTDDVIQNKYLKNKEFEILTKKNPETQRLSFYITNRTYEDLNVTFQLTLREMKADRELPVKFILPPEEQDHLIVSILPVDPSKAHYYTSKFSVYYGNPNAVHTGLYLPPVEKNKEFRIDNGFLGKMAHKNAYAIDIGMPIGTPVHAARDGTVVRMKNDSNRGGPYRSFEKDGNYILIRHDDGTYGNYVHFKKNGTAVKPGMRIKAGDLIGYSGNTGWSTGPHLHFDVSKVNEKGEPVTIPFQLISHDGKKFTPEEGMQILRK